VSPSEQEQQASILGAIPFAVTCGIELVGTDPEQVRATLQWAPERCTTGGILHGGVLMTLADTAGAVCAFLNLPSGATTATIESKINFFRAVRAGTVYAAAHPLHIGRTTIVIQTDLSDDSGRPVAQITQTQAVLRAQPDPE
jgi:1,4-dihydroxy-2-naphthoyl-CoA hydrolase